MRRDCFGIRDVDLARILHTIYVPVEDFSEGPEYGIIFYVPEP